MKWTAWHVHKSWFIAAALVLLVTGLADAVAACVAQRPIFWCTLIGSSLPLTMFLFVVIPLLRQESRKS